MRHRIGMALLLGTIVGIVFVLGCGANAPAPSGGDGLEVTVEGKPTPPPPALPAGYRLAFQRYVGKAAKQTTQIFSMSGSTLTQLTGGAGQGTSNVGPCWGPDGRSICFSSNRANNGSWALFTMDADGTGQTQLTSPPAGAVDSWSDWRGSSIVFQRDDPSAGVNEYQIMVVSAGGGTPRALTNGPGVGVYGKDDSPSFSPDGSMVVFRRSRAADGINGLLTIHTDPASDEAPVSLPGTQDASSPDWFPKADGSGSLIVYTDATGPDWGTMIVELDASFHVVAGPTEVCPSAVEAPAGSWDGKYLTFHDTTDQQVGYMNADGSGYTLLADGRYAEWAP